MVSKYLDTPLRNLKILLATRNTRCAFVLGHLMDAPLPTGRVVAWGPARTYMWQTSKFRNHQRSWSLLGSTKLGVRYNFATYLVKVCKSLQRVIAVKEGLWDCNKNACGATKIKWWWGLRRRINHGRSCCMPCIGTTTILISPPY